LLSVIHAVDPRNRSFGSISKFIALVFGFYLRPVKLYRRLFADMYGRPAHQGVVYRVIILITAFFFL